jgi:hypothetical protein
LKRGPGAGSGEGRIIFGRIILSSIILPKGPGWLPGLGTTPFAQK